MRLNRMNISMEWIGLIEVALILTISILANLGDDFMVSRVMFSRFATMILNGKIIFWFSLTCNSPLFLLSKHLITRSRVIASKYFCFRNLIRIFFSFILASNSCFSRYLALVDWFSLLLKLIFSLSFAYFFCLSMIPTAESTLRL